jgi:hypothetical protein
MIGDAILWLHSTYKEIKKHFFGGTPFISARGVVAIFVEFGMQGMVQFSIAVSEHFWS